MKKLWLWMALIVAAVPLGALASDELIGIGGTRWTRQYSEDTDEDCVVVQAGSSTCMLLPSGDVHDKGGNFDPLATAVSVTASGAGRCCYVTDPTFTIAGTEVADGSTGPGSCPFTFEAAGGRYDDRPDLLDMVAAGTNGITATGICSVPITNSGDSLYAPCTAGASCNSPYGGGSCTPFATATAVQKARSGVFIVCESDSGSINFTVRKQRVKK